MDPMRDEALIYERLLHGEGVPTQLEVFAGIPHGGPEFFPMLSVAGKSLNEVKAGVQWVLSQKA